MESEYQHRVLVVDDDERTGNTISRVLRKEDIVFVFTESAESALDQIKVTKKPFSIIIANQYLAGIKGAKLLQQAKSLAPESSRFLMATYSEFTTLVDAVNKGLIQRCIVKPLVDDDLLNTIRSGIRLFETFLENETLLNLAKKQNSQLYELSCQLMEAAKSRTKEILELDAKIDSFEKKNQDLSSFLPVSKDLLFKSIETSIKNDSGIDSQKAEALFSRIIRQLYYEFDLLAHQNGFEMPQMEAEPL